MISFIVIGQNEGWVIEKCFISIYFTISSNNIKSYEIIYVDSNSADDSIKLAQKHEIEKIYRITGTCNAAIARNVGAKMASGEIYFFIDGDMEIIPKQFNLLFREEYGLIYDFVSGNFLNIYYTSDGKELKQELQFYLVDDVYDVTTGGLFLITKRLWGSLNGMDNKFRRSQDLDFGLRAAKFGKKLWRKNILLAKHHTVSYVDQKRYIEDFFKGNYLYKGLLYKKNIFNKYLLRKYLIKEITFPFLIINIIAAILNTNLTYLIPYILIILVKTLIRKKINLSITFRFIHNILMDINLLFSLFLFWPKKNKSFSVVKIN
jgi:glycosyltransferase involved in cell wall biosynthesis